MSCPKSISFFFKSDVKSSCCIDADEPIVEHSFTNKVSGHLSKLCPQKWNSQLNLSSYNKIKDFFKQKSGPKFATTITFGKKYYWCMNTKEQYNAVRNILQAYVRERKSDSFYIAEINKAGVLHFHGIDCYDTQALFHERFKQFGTHNDNQKSYEPVVDTEKYLDYMFKDQFRSVFCAYDDEQCSESIQTENKYFGKKSWIFKYRPIFHIEYKRDEVSSPQKEA